MTEKTWQDSYYDGDDLIAPEVVVWTFDDDDVEWYSSLIPTETVVDEETWEWLQRMLDDPEEGDESELE